ncbi:hypothetical protein SteCoe_39096 [Stentor coeruleus]|uniref:Uncharacterized protein n=1 Tax=Stentor coeruleus TaxID=5963 RepID=A0A1R2AKX3_9CILI|nr:hypothetical protein SteCoe_39096 [Stentor coeruleus]
MDKNCGTSGCDKLATLKCTCKEEYKLCDWHMKKHSAVVGCYYKSFDKATLMLAIKDKLNALDNLSTETIQLASRMIIEINSYLKKNLAYIKKRKSQMVNFISENKNEQVDSIVSWAKSLKPLNRNKSDFICCMENLLCIDQNSLSELIGIEKLKNKIEENIYGGAKNTIKKQEEELIKYKEMYENKLNEIKEIEKKYNEEVKQDEDNLQSKQNSLDQAYIEIKKLESDIVNIKIEEAKKFQNLRLKFVYPSIGNF